MWKQFKNLGYSNKSNDNSKVILNIDKNICFEPGKIAQFVNNYFLNVANHLVDKLPLASNIFSTTSPLLKQYYTNMNCRPNNFILHPVSEVFINNELNNLNINKSTGYDEIPAKFLKNSSTEIREVITYLIDLSISTNIFPEELKYAKVKPLFKKGDKTEVENYRPISVLCIM